MADNTEGSTAAHVPRHDEAPAQEPVQSGQYPPCAQSTVKQEICDFHTKYLKRGTVEQNFYARIIFAF